VFLPHFISHPLLPLSLAAVVGPAVGGHDAAGGARHVPQVYIHTYIHTYIHIYIYIYIYIYIIALSPLARSFAHLLPSSARRSTIYSFSLPLSLSLTHSLTLPLSLSLSAPVYYFVAKRFLDDEQAEPSSFSIILFYFISYTGIYIYI
jgi:hypothetical protein